MKNLIFKFFFLLFIYLRSISTEKIPEYLSIETETSLVRENVYDFIRKAMETLILSYPDDSQIQNDYIKIFNSKGLSLSKFREPNSWHTTCLYIGKNYSQLNSYIYKNFEEGREINLSTSTFLYIPNKIMTSPVFIENFNLIDNKYPHITLMISKFRAVDSNYLLKSLFDNDPELSLLFREGKIESDEQLLNIKKKNVKIFFEDLNKSEYVDKVYILKNGDVLNLNGITKKNY